MTFLYFVLLLLGGTLHSDEGLPPVAALTSIESEPSTIIDSCVNAISGDYFDYEIDMVIPGPQPLKIERMLQGNNPHPLESTAYSSWVFNHEGSLVRKHDYYTSKVDFVYHLRKGLENSCTFDVEKIKTKKTTELKATVGSDQFLHGITNCSKGIISAQTNPNNRKLLLQCGSINSNVIMEDGTVLYFSGEKESKLNYEIYPSGLYLKYEYDKKLTTVSLKNKIQSQLSSYKIQGKKGIYSTDGRSARYEYDGDLLTRVVRTDAPTIDYEYYPKEHYFCLECQKVLPESLLEYKEKPKLAKKSYPEKRFKELVYYAQGMEPLQGHHVETKPSSAHFRRVAQILAPIGEDETPLVKYKFYYHWPNGPAHDGVTGVHDALNHCTNYTFNHRQRLTGITKIFANGIPYTEESLQWSDQNSSDAMRLITRSFKVHGAPYETFSRHYTYDEKGNILDDYLYGNICGSMHDCCHKSYSYSNDHYNLVTEVTEDSLRKTFHYFPNSNLLAECQHYCQEAVYLRHSYTYDANAIMVEHIIDDGSDTSMRKIERIKRSKTYPVGLPLEVEELHFDPNTGKEHLLLKKINTHDAIGRLIRQETYGSDDAFCFAEEWAYDHHGNLCLEINRLGQKVIRRYDDNDNMIYQKGPDDRLEQKFKYDYMNRLIQIDEIHPDGILSKKYRYDYCSNPIATIDVLGNETNTEYDEFNRPIRVIGAPLTNGERPVTHYEYDELSHPIKITSPDGHITTFAYTLLGKPYKIGYPDGTEEHFEYDLQGRLVKEVAKNGVQTLITYDAQGRVIKREVYSATDEFLFQTEARYDTFHLLEERDAAGTITSYSYDSLGRKRSMVKGDVTTTFDYDSLGRIVKTTCGSATCAVFDPLSRVIEERKETCDGKVLTQVKFSYDAAGNRSKIEQENSITFTEFDTHGIPRKVIDPDGNITYSTLHLNYYNTQGQRVFVLETIDPHGMITLSFQDTHGRVVETQKKNSWGQVIQKTTYQQNTSGACTATIETVYLPDKTTRQIINRFEYDSLGRHIATVQASGTPEEKRTSVQFNSFGQKISSTKPDGETIFYQYDALGRLSEYSSSGGSIHYRYTYDICSNPVQVENLVDHNATCRTYDPLSRLVEEKLANSLACQMAYTPEGCLKSLTLPDTSQIHYNYEGPILKQIDRFHPNGECLYSHKYINHDLAGRLLTSSLIHNLGNLSHQYTLNGQIANIASPFYQADLKYDALGNLLKRSYKDNFGLQEEQFTYDPLNQLKSEIGACFHTYTHDSLYNRCSKDDRIHHHNALNQLLSDGETEFSYDMNGNLTKEARPSSTRTFTYDALDRLKSLHIDNQSWEFFYDEENRCISYHHNHQTEKILYVGQNDIGTSGEDGIHTLRVLGKGLGAEIGAAVAVEIHGKIYAPLHDQNGNVTTLLDSTGIPAETYRYSSFGEEQFTPVLENPWRFASKRHFDDYLLFGRRFYDPSQGRWLTQDPIGYDGGPNLYAYVSNNPLTHFDPYGLAENSGFFDSLWDICTWAFDFISSSWCGIRDSCSRKYESMKEGMNSVFDFTVQAIKFVGNNLAFTKHAIMFPILRDAGALPHFLAEGTFEGYSWTWTQESSQYVDGEGEYLLANVRAIYCNGIHTTFDQFKWNLNYLSDLFGMRVDGSYNSTDCIPVDLFETLLQKFGIPTESVNVLVNALRSKIHEVGGVGSNGLVIAIAHSQGGQILHCALKQLSTEERSMIAACTLGSAKLIEKEMGLKYLRNYVSTHDNIPRLGDPLHYRLAKSGLMSEVSFINSLEPSFLDHNFSGKTYGKALERFRKDLYKDFLR